MHNIGYLTPEEKCDRSAVVNEICEIAMSEGDGYSGPMHWHDEVAPLKNYGAAMDWIESHDNGWYDDHAVRYYDYRGGRITAKIRELQDKSAALAIKIKDYEEAHSVRKFKAVFVGCPHCGSKLAREWLRSDFCPLCRADLRSKTTLDTLGGYREKQKDIADKIKAEQEKQKGEVRWLVKYEFHS